MKISNLSNIIPGAKEEGISLLSGYQSVWACTMVDNNDVPIDLTGKSIDAEAEIYTCEVVFGGRGLSITEGSLERVPGNKIDLTVTIDPDQATNPGIFTILMPDNILSGVDLVIDSSRRAMVVVYLLYTNGLEKRPGRMVALFGKGEAVNA